MSKRRFNPDGSAADHDTCFNLPFNKIIIDVDFFENNFRTSLVVRTNPNGLMDVLVGGNLRHADCSPEDVMRAMGNYIHGMAHLMKSWSK